MDENSKKQQQKLNIERTEEIAEGTDANLAAITHSNAEFIVDFINMMPGAKKAKVKSRIILTPQHAKRLSNAPEDDSKKFEVAPWPHQGNTQRAGAFTILGWP
ncbi:MAG: DUF3467 domain-containing protein [Bacteroidales bacterium]|nr:DUF3467 domain-containing protein [Bacteroidales bacterium]